jgi:thiamine-phosphate pyrophosphorylase
MNEQRHERRQRLNAIDLYPVTSAAHSAGRSTLEIIDACVAAGCKIVQLREKELCKRDYFELAVEVRARTAGMLLICNDHLDVALCVGADGVHLGNDDLPLAAARRLAAGLLLGKSSHSLSEALAAVHQGADYVNIGPIFPTETKALAKDFLGPQAIRDIAPKLDLPFTVMGGIKADNLDLVLDAGARRIAVVTAVTKASDPAAAARALRARILAAGRAAMGPG